MNENRQDEPHGRMKVGWLSDEGAMEGVMVRQC